LYIRLLVSYGEGGDGEREREEENLFSAFSA
jgi:hypothetical protein